MKLTVVTPSYNQGKYIGDTFDSILNQKIEGFDFEYILFDAVSSDSTKDVIEEYKPKFKKAGIDFKCFIERDRGQSDAINKGWRMADGDIVAYLNSDDYFEPNIFKMVMDYFKNNPKVKWAYGGWKLVDQTGKVYQEYQPKRYSKAKLLNYCNIGQPSCFLRRELLDEFGMFREDLHLAMDYDLWLRFASKYPASIIKKILSNMRYHADAKTGSQALGTLKTVFDLSKRYTKPLSYRRLMQNYYYLRGLAVTKIGFDITRRINRQKNR